MPGYLTSSSADSPPSASPSSAGSTGAVKGAHPCSRTVPKATRSPPIAPSMIQGAATDGSRAARTWLQTHAAGTTTRKRRNAALLTVPSSVMDGAVGSRRRSARSEEHTSELQSQSNLVCRLLLEKKKYIQ